MITKPHDPYSKRSTVFRQSWTPSGYFCCPIPGPVHAAGDFLAGELAGGGVVLQVVLPGNHDVARVRVVVQAARGVLKRERLMKSGNL